MDNRRRSVCGHKIKHYSRGKAEAALRSMARLEGVELEDLHVYACPFSGKIAHYHVGHIAHGNPKSRYKK